MKYFLTAMTLAVFGMAASGCKSSGSSQLKDDILVKGGADGAVLYWLIAVGEEQHVCRAVCAEDKIVAKGDIQETRNSCDKEKMQSIPAQLFAQNEDLKGVFTVFSKSLANNKVAVLSTDVADAKLKESNEKRLAALNSLFSDENMYLDAKVKELRDAGLVGFGQENAVRHHPACLDPQAATPSGSLATNVGTEKQEDQQQLETPKIQAKRAAMLFLPKATYGSLVSFLEGAANSPDFNSRAFISGSTSLGTEYLQVIHGQTRTFIAVSGDRGPILVDRQAGQDKTMYLEDPKSHAAWSQFARALFNLGVDNSRESGQQGFGTQVRVKKADVQIESFIVSISVPQGNDFSSPGEKLENTFRVTPFKQDSKEMYALQFDIVETQPANPSGR